MYFEIKYLKRNTAIRFFRCEIISYLNKRKEKLYTNLIQFGLYEKILMRKKRITVLYEILYGARENFWLDKSLF